MCRIRTWCRCDGVEFCTGLSGLQAATAGTLLLQNCCGCGGTVALRGVAMCFSFVMFFVTEFLSRTLLSDRLTPARLQAPPRVLTSRYRAASLHHCQYPQRCGSFGGTPSPPRQLVLAVECCDIRCHEGNHRSLRRPPDLEGRSEPEPGRRGRGGGDGRGRRGGSPGRDGFLA